MTKTRKIQPWRRLAEAIQAIIIIGLPFVRIKGESALRFDVPTLQLHFFGLTLWMEEFFIVLIALIFLSLLVIFITLLLGRIWCGWLCPQTVIADFTVFVEKARGRGGLHKLSAWTAVFIISVLMAANLIWYFVSPYEFLPRLVEGELGDIIRGFWIVLTVLLFLNYVLLRQRFCATVCPYAKLQSTLFDNRTLVVAFDPRRKDECMDCMACVKTCPVGIDIRKGPNVACIHCAECIDRCAMMMAPRKKDSLTGYFFGLPGEGGRGLRQNAVLIGTVTAAFLIFFLYLLITRVPLDMTVLPNYVFQPRALSNGSIINSYVISVKNRGSEDAVLHVRVKGIEGDVKIVPDKDVHVIAGEIKKFPVYISVRNLEGGELKRELDIIMEPVEGGGSIGQKANFIIPEVE
ncbi:MAG: 4Fe-4S binding protein [Nitrospiraceae bacterium]|nr:MAG: 4Fe-4S binding protein [Nitrospiraceae bacterium]